MRIGRIGGGWVAAAWLVWPVVLVGVPALAVYAWLRLDGATTMWGTVNVGFVESPTWSWAGTLEFVALVALLVGPPLALTLAWRRARRG